MELETKSVSVKHFREEKIDYFAEMNKLLYPKTIYLHHRALLRTNISKFYIRASTEAVI